MRAFSAILIVGGLAIAGLGVHSYWTARQGERQAEEQWKSQLARQPQAPPRAHRGDTVARLFIERLESHWVVIEGGHRDTQFRILRRVKIGEDISVEAGGRTFVYHVTDRRVVAPADTRSLDPTPTATLTLVTCYPFYYVGPAPKRFIIRAALVSAAAGSRG